jgi:hypothetical protein
MVFFDLMNRAVLGAISLSRHFPPDRWVFGPALPHLGPLWAASDANQTLVKKPLKILPRYFREGACFLGVGAVTLFLI